MRAALVLTDRDLDALTLTGLCAYVSTNQIAREFFPTLDRARRRLRVLFDAGYVAVTLASSTLPNLVSLTRKGLSTVSEARGEVADRLRLAGTIRLAGVRHHLGVVDVRLYAAVLGAKRGAPLVRWSNGSSERFKAFGFDAARLSPDGLAEFQTPRGPVAVAVEVDLGTETLAVLSRKWKKYRRVAAAEAVDALWVYVDAGAARRAAVVETLAAEALTEWSRVLGDEVVRRPIIELPARAELLARADPTTSDRSEASRTNDKPHRDGNADA